MSPTAVLDGGDPFVALGLTENATNRDVESAFRKRALRCHPDRHPNDSLAKARFLRLSHAKEALLDPKRRRAVEQRRTRTGVPSAASNHTTARSAAPARSAAQRAAQRTVNHAEAQRAAKRREMAERLRRREQEATKARRKAAEVAEQRRQRLAKEEREREREANKAQQKEEIFEAWRRRQHVRRDARTFDEQHNAPASPLRALLDRFAASRDRSFLLDGHAFDARERADFIRAAETLNFKVVQDNYGLRILKTEQGRQASTSGAPESADATEPDQQSGSDSPWEPPGGTELHKKPQRERLRKRRRTSSDLPEQTERQQKAIDRLKTRRENGETPDAVGAGYWWVQDEAADRYLNYVDQCGY